MKICPRCGARIPADTAFCSVCGQKQLPAYSQNPPYHQPGYRQQPYGQPGNQNPYYGNRPPYTPNGYHHPGQGQTRQNGVQSFLDRLTGAVNHFAGGEGSVRLPVRYLFSETFKKHTEDEAEAIFVCGTPRTTPQLTSAETVWPRPWLYARILAAFAIAFFMLHICCETFANPNAYPGAILMGSFMVPVAVMVFFFELNTPKNISFYTLLKIFLVGGCGSLLLTLFLYEVFPFGNEAYLNAIVISIVEELGKVGIVAYFLSREKDAQYNINGLLVGAAVGAGFAAFESAGYAYRWLISDGYAGMLDVIFVRAVLAPGGHVVWAAMSGYAIMLVKKHTGRSLTGFLGQSRFWQIFWMPVAMHAVWDMPIPIGQEIYLVPILLVILSWVVIFVLINNSLGQLSRLLRNETFLYQE